MTPSTEDQKKIRQYLLGNLPQDLRRQLEERLLIEDSFFEELTLGEEALIDEYVEGDLSDEERLQFDENFLSTPERQQKLSFARSLNRYASDELEKEAPQPAKPQTHAPTGPSLLERINAFWNNLTPPLRAAVALGAVAFIAGALWFSVLRTPAPKSFATLSLTLGSGTRSEGVRPEKVKLPLGHDALRISLRLPEQQAATTRYRVKLESVGGASKPLEIERQDAQTISVVIPAAELTRGQYAIKLSTLNADGTEQPINGGYYFNVE